jgi:hypothetical protein
MRLLIGGSLLLQALASPSLWADAKSSWADKQSSWDVDWDDVWNDIANMDDEDRPTKLSSMITPGETARAKALLRGSTKSLLRGSTSGTTAYSSTLAKFVQKYHPKSDTVQISGDGYTTDTAKTGEETKLLDGLSAKKATIEIFVEQVHKNTAQAKRLLAGASQRRKVSAWEEGAEPPLLPTVKQAVVEAIEPYQQAVAEVSNFEAVKKLFLHGGKAERGVGRRERALESKPPPSMSVGEAAALRQQLATVDREIMRAGTISCLCTLPLHLPCTPRTPRSPPTSTLTTRAQGELVCAPHELVLSPATKRGHPRDEPGRQPGTIFDRHRHVSDTRLKCQGTECLDTALAGARGASGASVAPPI